MQLSRFPKYAFRPASAALRGQSSLQRRHSTDSGDRLAQTPHGEKVLCDGDTEP
jgi:hypothetical protein